jgi:starch-binding outer membrane protein, SusD/RagB family
MMRMKKILLKIVGGFMFASAIISCQDDFLSTTPLSEIAESNVWSSSKLAEAAVLDLYQGTWAGTLTREETTDAFTDQAVFTHPGRGVDG